ncbi:31622_t:CDS:2, partial [Gigaspora margarita]
RMHFQEQFRKKKIVLNEEVCQKFYKPLKEKNKEQYSYKDIWNRIYSNQKMGAKKHKKFLEPLQVCI